MEDFSALKCIAIVELFYVTIYKQVFTFWFKESQKQMEYLCIFENCITQLAFSLQPLYETLNA